MKPLTYPMKLALRQLSDSTGLLPDGWVLASDHDLRSLRALASRGLVEFGGLDDQKAYHRVRLTEAGQAAALALYKYKGRAS